MTAKLTFDDEFNTLSVGPTSASNWQNGFYYDTTSDNNGDWAGVTPGGWSPYAITTTNGDGVLDMTIRTTPTADVAAVGGAAHFETGMLTTYQSFSQTYGYFEMRAEFSGATGIQPAFWLLPESGAWPPELDVDEFEGGNPTAMISTAHPANINSAQEQIYATVANGATGFHTYGMDWEATNITFYFDGAAVGSVATPAGDNVPLYMLVTLTADGWQGNTNAATPASNTIQVDYVRAWSSMPTATQEAAVPTGATAPVVPPVTPPVVPPVVPPVTPPVVVPPVVVPQTTYTMGKASSTYNAPDNQIITAASGNHTVNMGSNDVFISGDTTAQAGGQNTLVLKSTSIGDKIEIPMAGHGYLNAYATDSTPAGPDMLTALHTAFDFSEALSATAWTGSSSTLAKFLKVATANIASDDPNGDMTVSVVVGSRTTAVAILGGMGNHTLADLQSHGAIF